MKVVLGTGGFDPLHSGHIEYFRAAKKLGDVLVVGINSDEWLTRKKGRPFMPFKERLAIIESLEMVDDVMSFEDKDDTASHAIFKLMCTSASRADIIFANGGDRSKGAVPEEKTFSDKVEFVYGVGGENKKNSSSWILEEWKNPKTVRNWGWYRVLDEGEGWAVKEVTILPGNSLSDQKHLERSEHWHVVQGEVTIQTEWMGVKRTDIILPTQSFDIGKEVWHKPSNKTKAPAKIIETWFGDELTELDIERR